MCTCYLSSYQETIDRFWPVGRCNQARRAERAFPGGEDPGVRLGENVPGRERVVSQWGLIRGFARSANLPDLNADACFEEVAGLKCATPVELIEAGLKE